MERTCEEQRSKFSQARCFCCYGLAPPFSKEMFGLAWRCFRFLPVANLYDSPFISRMWT